MEEKKNTDKEAKEKFLEQRVKETEDKIEKAKGARLASIEQMKHNTKEIRKYDKDRFYKRQEQEYVNELESELDRRKKALSDIRDLHKPIDHHEIVTFSKQMADISNEKISKLREEREKVYKDRIRSYDYAKYKSKFLEPVIESEKQEVEQAKFKEEEKKRMYEKKVNYGRLVKEMHPPRISEKKRYAWKKRYLLESKCKWP